MSSFTEYTSGESIYRAIATNSGRRMLAIIARASLLTWLVGFLLPRRLYSMAEQRDAI